MITWVIASHNAGKVMELAELLAPKGISCRSAQSFNLPTPQETGETFEDNAALKAKAACEATGQVCIADDSGLCVTSLAGKPGVHTADWAGPDRDWRLARERLQEELVDKSRLATFVSVLCVVSPDGSTWTARGELNGKLIWPPRGEYGGFEPMFVPQGHEQTLAELGAKTRMSIHHRRRALEALEQTSAFS